MCGCVNLRVQVALIVATTESDHPLGGGIGIFDKDDICVHVLNVALANGNVIGTLGGSSYSFDSGLGNPRY